MTGKIAPTAIVPASDRENLNRPVDAEIQVEQAMPRTAVRLVAGGEVVSSLWIIHFDQQIGLASVKMGGIAGVATPEEHRMKGYARVLMWNSLRWMRSAGFDTAMLYGIRDFYPKFGYAAAFPNVTFSVAVRDAEGVACGGLSAVDYAPAHLAGCLGLYAKCNAGRTGPTRRDPAYWRPFRMGARWGARTACKVFLDSRKKVAGYLVWDNQQHLAPINVEIGYSGPRVFPAILQQACHLALDLRMESIRWSLPEDEPFKEFLKPLGLRTEVQCRRNNGAMIRMINAVTALVKVGGDLAARMPAPGRLNVLTNLDRVGLAWSGGKMTVGGPIRGAASVRTPQWALAQMLYGYRSASALATTGDLKGPPQAVEALDRMLPPRPHYHYVVDQF